MEMDNTTRQLPDVVIYSEGNIVGRVDYDESTKQYTVQALAEDWRKNTLMHLQEVLNHPKVSMLRTRRTKENIAGELAFKPCAVGTYPHLVSALSTLDFYQYRYNIVRPEKFTQDKSMTVAKAEVGRPRGGSYNSTYISGGKLQRSYDSGKSTPIGRRRALSVLSKSVAELKALSPSTIAGYKKHLTAKECAALDKKLK